jgi:hypothetical protein
MTSSIVMAMVYGSSPELLAAHQTRSLVRPSSSQRAVSGSCGGTGDSYAPPHAGE